MSHARESLVLGDPTKQLQVKGTPCAVSLCRCGRCLWNVEPDSHGEQTPNTMFFASLCYRWDSTVTMTPSRGSSSTVTGPRLPLTAN